MMTSNYDIYVVMLQYHPDHSFEGEHKYYDSYFVDDMLNMLGHNRIYIFCFYNWYEC